MKTIYKGKVIDYFQSERIGDEIERFPDALIEGETLIVKNQARCFVCKQVGNPDEMKEYMRGFTCCEF